MKVGVIGSGGREHALCLSLKKSNLVEKIYCLPGNAGTNQIAENINIDLDDFEKIKDFILENNLEFIIVGPEKPLVDGIVDYLRNFNHQGGIVASENKFIYMKPSKTAGTSIFHHILKNIVYVILLY